MRLKIASGIVILALILTIFAAGCTSTQNTSTQSGQSSNSISISAKAVQSPQQFGNASFGISTPKPGDEYVMYNVTLTNINAAYGPTASASKFTLQDTNNNSYSVTEIIQLFDLGHAFPYSGEQVAPGERVNGLMMFEVPQGLQLSQ